VKFKYIDPGILWKNGHSACFNGVFMVGSLDCGLFYLIQEAKKVIDSWLDEHNNGRPHGDLDGKIPVTFMGIYAKRKK